MTPREALIHARELLSVELWWTKGASARDADGNVVFSNDPDAVCWCSIGAIYRVTGGDHCVYMPALRALDESVTPVSGRVGVGEWNDDPRTTHAEILGAFDIAIRRA